MSKEPQVSVQIKAPNFNTAVFTIKGTAPLVIHRFSAKTKQQMKQKMEEGKSSSSKKNREAKNTDEAEKLSGGGLDIFLAATAESLAAVNAARKPQ